MNPTRRLLLLQALSAPALAAQGTGPGRDWPLIELLDGGRFAPSHWQDRAAVLVFFATHCPFCRRHNQHIEKLHRASQGLRLQVLGAALDREPAPVRSYLAKARYSFPVTMQGPSLRALFSARQLMPLTVTLDRQGAVRAVVPGEMFEEDVLELLALAKA